MKMIFRALNAKCTYVRVQNFPIISLPINYSLTQHVVVLIFKTSNASTLFTLLTLLTKLNPSPTKLIKFKSLPTLSPMDINEPKSRSFNMYLRYFQMGLQVLIASKLSQINSSSCEHTFQKIGQIVTLAIIVLNLLAMIVTRFTTTFPRIFFFVVFLIDIVLAAIIVVLGIVGSQEYNSCANNKVLHRFAMVEGLIAVVLAFMIVFLPFHWIQRYSNTPGNIAWIFLFFAFAWTPQYKLPMLIEGIIFITISAMSFGVNLVACRGITTRMKKLIVIEWIFALILMVVGQILAIVVYLQESKSQQFMDGVAIKTLQTFICVNFLDLLFWLWGYLTLEYENGDKIRDELMRGKNDHDESEDVEPYQMNEEVQNPGFGTIRR